MLSVHAVEPLLTWGETYFFAFKKKKKQKTMKGFKVARWHKKWAVQHATKSYSLIFSSKMHFIQRASRFLISLRGEEGWTKLSILQVKTVRQCEIHQRDLFWKGENAGNKKHFLVLTFLSKLNVFLVCVHSTKSSSKICKDPFFSLKPTKEKKQKHPRPYFGSNL